MDAREAVYRGEGRGGQQLQLDVEESYVQADRGFRTRPRVGEILRRNSLPPHQYQPPTQEDSGLPSLTAQIAALGSISRNAASEHLGSLLKHRHPGLLQSVCLTSFPGILMHGQTRITGLETSALLGHP